MAVNKISEKQWGDADNREWGYLKKFSSFDTEELQTRLDYEFCANCVLKGCELRNSHEIANKCSTRKVVDIAELLTEIDWLKRELIHYQNKERNNQKPLTPDELKMRDGKIVWCIDGSGYSAWCIVDRDSSKNARCEIPDCLEKKSRTWAGALYGRMGSGVYGLYGRGWLAFDQEARETESERYKRSVENGG